MVTNTLERRTWATTPEMLENIKKEFGPEAYDVARNSVELKTYRDQNTLIKDFQGAGLNGQAKLLAPRITAKMQESERQEKLQETWMQKGWKWTKETAKKGAEVVSTPFRWGWQTMKKHPRLTAAAVILLALGGGVALASSMGWINLNALGALLGPYLEKIRNLAGQVAEKGKELIGKGAEAAAQAADKAKDVAAEAASKGNELLDRAKDVVPPPKDIPAPPTNPDDFFRDIGNIPR